MDWPLRTVLPLFPKGGVDGELSVELDGKSVTIPLGVR